MILTFLKLLEPCLNTCIMNFYFLHLLFSLPFFRTHCVVIVIVYLPSTNEVSNVTLAALRLPAGNAKPIRSNLSLRYLPPFLDLAL